MLILRTAVFILLGLAIVSWFVGWDFIYRPVASGPVISPFTAAGFIVLFILQAIPLKYRLGVESNKALKLVLIVLASLLMLIEMFQHVFSDEGTVLGSPISSLPTIFTIFAFIFYEALNLFKSRMTILADIAFIVAFIWIYLSLVGHVLGYFYLTGALTNPDLGLSIPTLIAGLVYMGMAAAESRILVSMGLYKSVPWIRKIIQYSLPLFLIAPIIVITLMEAYLDLTEENELLLFIAAIIFQFFIGAFYIILLIQVSDTHTKIETICSYTHKFKTSDGKWIPLESFLFETYGISVSHGISEEAEKTLYEALDLDKPSDS